MVHYLINGHMFLLTKRCSLKQRLVINDVFVHRAKEHKNYILPLNMALMGTRQFSAVLKTNLYSKVLHFFVLLDFLKLSCLAQTRTRITRE